MERRDGTDYVQNYDIIIRLMAGALKRETLEVIGVKTGRIIPGSLHDPQLSRPAGDTGIENHGSGAGGCETVRGG